MIARSRPYTAKLYNQKDISASNQNLIKGVSISRRPQTTSSLSERKTLSKTRDETQLNYIDNEDIIINVFDEIRNAKREFHCKKSILVKEMNYFARLLDDGKSVIEVHSDLEVFEKLMGFCFLRDIDLDHKNVVSILISSHFLGMNVLETKCLDFFKTHAQDILKLPIDFNCLNLSIKRDLSERFSAIELYHLKDPKDKLKSFLYKEKIIAMPFLSQYSLCLACKSFFRIDEADLCSFTFPTIDKEGNILRKHTADKKLKAEDWIAAVFLICECDWERCYWWFWAFSSKMECLTCKHEFRALKVNFCCQHPQPVTSSLNRLCRQCQKPLYPFIPFEIERGCRHIAHTTDGTSNTEIIFNTVKNLIIREDSNLTNKPCTHSQDLRMSTLTPEFFQSWITEKRKTRNDIISNIEVSKLKPIYQRESDKIKMKSMIQFIRDNELHYRT